MAVEKGNAVCASRVRDTVKRTDDSSVVSAHVDRDNLWLIQTPQVFEKKMYADDPAHKFFSQHAQVWAVLSGGCDTEVGKIALIRSFDCVPKSTFAFLLKI